MRFNVCIPIWPQPNMRRNTGSSEVILQQTRGFTEDTSHTVLLNRAFLTDLSQSSFYQYCDTK